VSSPDLFLLVGLGLMVLGTVRLLLTGDLIRRVLGFNVAGAGVLLVLGTVAARSDPDDPDPVPHALVLTGIVVTVSVTAVALGLVRRIELAADSGEPVDETPADEPDRDEA
jgi:multicomponent Na+:H+ antiporter subunit C